MSIIDWLRRLFGFSDKRKPWPEVIIDPLATSHTNSVSRGEIRMNPYAPYCLAIFAQELWEYRHKYRTGTDVSVYDECRSWECQVQAYARHWVNGDEEQYRIDQAKIMHWYDGYDFKRKGWTHKDIVNKMREYKPEAERWVDNHWDHIMAFKNQLNEWRAKQ